VLRGWLSFYRTGVWLGLRSLLTGHFTRDALIRVLAPVEDTRLFELPETVAALEIEGGQRVLDLASPKLAAVCLARAGAEVTSVDAYEPEIAAWRVLAGHVRGLSFQVADARRLPFPDEAFDHAYSISVIEHIGEDGDFQALAELARVVKPGGRIVITVPYATSYGEDWRGAPLYGEHTQQKDGRWFFSRTYDDERLARLVAATPLIRKVWSRAVHFESSRLYRFYYRNLPMSVVLNPLLGLTLRVVDAPGGLIMLALVRMPGGADSPAGKNQL
jgi:SAM-dependent methyltransferase